MAFHPNLFKPLIIREMSESIVYVLEFQVNYEAWIRLCFKKQKRPERLNSGLSSFGHNSVLAVHVCVERILPRVAFF